MKDKRRPHALCALSLRLGLLVFTLWFVCMGLFTYGTAQYVLNDLLEVGSTYAENNYYRGRFERFYGPDAVPGLQEKPGAIDYAINTALPRNSRVYLFPPSFPRPASDNISDVFCSDSGEAETATVIYDGEGSFIRGSGNLVGFHYRTEENWREGSQLTDGYAWIDLDELDDPRFDLLRYYCQNEPYMETSVFRITGRLNGARLEPAAVAVATEQARMNGTEQLMPGFLDALELNPELTPQYTVEELDAQGVLEWKTLLEPPEHTDGDLITVYSDRPEFTAYEPKGEIRYRDETYENLLEALKSMSDYAEDEYDGYLSASQFSMTNLIVVSQHSVFKNVDRNGNFIGGQPERAFVIMTAMHANPLLIATGFLRNVWLITGAGALLGFLLLRNTLKKRLITPLETINGAVEEGYVHLPEYIEHPPCWKEPFDLYEHYTEAKDRLYLKDNEIRQLKTSLRYAQDAEERRKQLVSNVAHELKTPLAVVHSYAEGLQERIAEDKRDQYLGTILSESERMDAMVLEMLDLSRLEAGRIRLSREDFSLSELTQAVFSRLERAAEEKKLQITFDFPQDCMVTADESRMAQVIENFASNAIKYTPEGGHIGVTIEKQGRQTVFRIANDCSPLSEQTLKRVWDAFYRAEEARSGGSTGLGLAIVKNIISLHGGSCSVRNTETGAEFRFTI